MHKSMMRIIEKTQYRRSCKNIWQENGNANEKNCRNRKNIRYRHTEGLTASK